MTAADRPLGLSVFFPACDDGGTIASLVVQAVKAASRLALARFSPAAAPTRR